MYCYKTKTVMVFLKEVGPREPLSRCEGQGVGEGEAASVRPPPESSVLHVSGTLRAPGWWVCRVRQGPPRRAGGPSAACVEDTGGHALFQEPLGSLHQARGTATSVPAQEPGCGAASLCPAPYRVSRYSCCR